MRKLLSLSCGDARKADPKVRMFQPGSLDGILPYQSLLGLSPLFPVIPLQSALRDGNPGVRLVAGDLPHASVKIEFGLHRSHQLGLVHHGESTSR